MRIEQIVVIDGEENFDAAQRRGKGVLFLDGPHERVGTRAVRSRTLRASAAFSGTPDREIGRVDALINGYRCLSGNLPIDKNKSARAILKVLGQGGTVGILADHNTTPEEGVFVDFFGIPASTTSGLARIALHTDAAVVPGFLSWDDSLRKYRLGFQPAVDFAHGRRRSGRASKIRARFTRIIERMGARASGPVALGA